MLKTYDLLIEIGTEELPATGLCGISEDFANKLQTICQKLNLSFSGSQSFATPRRLAVILKELSSRQPDKIVEKRGPSWDKAFNADGSATSAALGFAKSCNVSINELEKLETDDGVWTSYREMRRGLETRQILPDIIRESVTSLTISKAMRWNDGATEFVRPVHWVVILYGKETIKMELLGVNAGNTTFGHRFLYPCAITLTEPQDYPILLREHGFVIAGFAERRQEISAQLAQVSQDYGRVVVNQSLLNEVTGLVEWPVAILGNYAEHFLALPREVLISVLQKHQKGFSVCDKSNNLLPHFVTIANIESKNPSRIISGNERVVNARLSDAEFFYERDIKRTLEEYLQDLQKVVFQAELGSVYAKAIRISKLAEYIAQSIGIDSVAAKRAGLLAKADLATEMVREFTELQGTMGFYYAQLHHESDNIAQAIFEHYLPKFSEDSLPKTIFGSIVGLADKIDTLVGILGINKMPTGDKDPFGLRRAAIGIVRIILNKDLRIDVQELLFIAQKNYEVDLPNNDAAKQAMKFIFDRLRNYYLEQGIAAQLFVAVLEKYPTDLMDFAMRLQALQDFCKLEEADFLIAAHKRVNNILKKVVMLQDEEIDYSLLFEPAEKILVEQVVQRVELFNNLYNAQKYKEAMKLLAELKTPIDSFFDSVMVMVDDVKLQKNRLIILFKIRDLLAKIAEISLLGGGSS